MAIKSILIQVGVDTAGAAHNCRANKRHRIQRGDVRLKVREGLGWQHYCRSCGQEIIAKAARRLRELEPMTPTGPSSVPLTSAV